MRRGDRRGTRLIAVVVVCGLLRFTGSSFGVQRLVPPDNVACLRGVLANSRDLVPVTVLVVPRLLLLVEPRGFAARKLRVKLHHRVGSNENYSLPHTGNCSGLALQ